MNVRKKGDSTKKRRFQSLNLFRNAACVAAVCFLLISCAKPQIVRDEEAEPFAGPVTLELLKQSVGFGDEAGIKSPVRVKVFNEGNVVGNFNGVLAYKKPSLMRVSLFGPFGLTLLDLIASRDVFQAFVPNENILYEWENPNIMFSIPPDGPFIYDMFETDDMILLEMFLREGNEPEHIAAFYFDRAYVLNRAMVFYKGSARIMHLSFGAFTGRIPSRISMFFPTGASIEIIMDDLRTGVDIPDDYFRPLDHRNKIIRPFEETLDIVLPRK